MPKKLSPRGTAALPVEPNIAQAALPPRQPKPTPRTPKIKPGAKYVRNLRAIECRFTLTTKRRIELRPRGQRGDLDIVNKNEQDDPIFLLNEGLLFEVVEPKEAREIIAKQQINASQEEHPLWSHLRNEQGQGYDQRDVHVNPTFESQGEVVGEIHDTGSGRYSDHNKEVVRRPGASPQIAQVPGSPDHPATEYMQSVPSDIPPEEYHEFLLWKRFKAAMEAQAAPENLNVTVEPVQPADGDSE